MKTSEEVLSSILKTTQMGQVGIRAVLNQAVKPELKSALQSQLHEYDAIEEEALEIANARGWNPEELDPATRAMSKMYARTNLTFGHVDSKIAAMMIQGNTRGVIKTLKNHHHAQGCDEKVAALSRKLIQCENDNIRQMQGHV